MGTVEDGKKAAAEQGVEHALELLRAKGPGVEWVVGIGSGSTVVYAVRHLAEKVRDAVAGEGGPKAVVCIPSSFQATHLIREHGLNLGELNAGYTVDVTIDGADEVDPQLDLIKGGGGCQTLEKLLAAASRELVIIADYRKRSDRLNTKFGFVPVEVVPSAYVFVTEQLKNPRGGLGLDAATQAARAVTLRMAKAKAGPVVTDNGNFLLDVDYGGIEDAKALERQLTMLPGVVTVGLFIGMAGVCFFGNEDGSTSSISRAK
eukprot:TRINITY_DN2422_c0_g2_i1.p1 TRINITY_DN2422_c0_g2~~TRINITY_DN2422_c0_g2_i1.p1  ORF type:complete len:276 (+),score=99.07 TRINITY_DN2422_c0_g2_i1:48-830(+)